MRKIVVETFKNTSRYFPTIVWLFLKQIRKNQNKVGRMPYYLLQVIQEI